MVNHICEPISSNQSHLAAQLAWGKVGAERRLRSTRLSIYVCLLAAVLPINLTPIFDELRPDIKPTISAPPKVCLRSSFIIVRVCYVQVSSCEKNIRNIRATDPDIIRT